MNTYENVFEPDNPCNIIYHSDRFKEEKHGFVLHWHEHMELLYFSKAENVVVYFNNIPVTVQEGDLLIVNSNVLHELPPDKCNYHCIILKKQFIDSIFQDRDLHFNRKIGDPTITAILKSLIFCMDRKTEFYQAEAQGYATLLLCRLAQNYMVTDEEILDLQHAASLSLTKKAISYILSHYMEDFTLEEIADYMGCSKFYLCKIFKKNTGRTVVEYRNHLRCVKAKQLMMEEHYCVKESAIACGYTNFSYFSKTYKKYIGNLPSQDT